MSKLTVRRLKPSQERLLEEKLADCTLSAYVLDRYRIIQAINDGSTPTRLPVFSAVKGQQYISGCMHSMNQDFPGSKRSPTHTGDLSFSLQRTSGILLGLLCHGRVTLGYLIRHGLWQNLPTTVDPKGCCQMSAMNGYVGCSAEKVFRYSGQRHGKSLLIESLRKKTAFLSYTTGPYPIL